MAMTTIINPPELRYMIIILVCLFGGCLWLALDSCRRKMAKTPCGE